MATLTVTKPLFGDAANSTGGSTANYPYLIQVVVDYSQQSVGSTDLVEALTIPANSLVLTAGAECLTNDSGNGTVAIKMDSVVFAVATDLQLGTITEGNQFPGQDAATEFFLFTNAANTIDCLNATAVFTTGKIRVWALVVSLDDPITEQRVTIA